jgi:SPP1 gp7 family putative phage head morphogenesis protein
MQGFASQATAKLLQQVNIGYADNLKPSDVTKAIIGTKDAGYKDGLLGQLQRQGDAVTNTVIQHVASQTNSAVAKKGFEQYLWVSVLDSRTTQICTDRNGNVYVYGQGPTPPAHINCRSSTIPFDGTGPVTMPTFTVWVNGQSQEFRNDAFDGPVTASYEGSSPIDLEQFKSKRGFILA